MRETYKLDPEPNLDLQNRIRDLEDTIAKQYARQFRKQFRKTPDGDLECVSCGKVWDPFEVMADRLCPSAECPSNVEPEAQNG